MVEVREIVGIDNSNPSKDLLHEPVNSQSIQVDRAGLLKGLSESVLKTEVVDYAVAKMEEALSKQFADLDAELARLHQRKQDLELELKRLTDSIAQGKQSHSIMNAIAEREEELHSITDKLIEPAPGSIRAKLEELREFAVARLTKIRELLAHPENVQKAHEVLAERIGQLTLEPVDENGKKTYLAHGKVDFFGEESVAHSDGAGGPARTDRDICFTITIAA
jgi:predicted RNase H-like nuclease (RuvC/YqgF family)